MLENSYICLNLFNIRLLMHIKYFMKSLKHKLPCKNYAVLNNSFTIYKLKKNNNILNISLFLHTFPRGGWVRRRCPVAFVTRAPNWYWLPVGQSLLSLQQAKVEGECCYFFCSFTFFHFPLSFLSFSFISSTISLISFLPFSGRQHKITH